MSIPAEGSGDRDPWMTMFSTLDDDVVDALLEGHAPDDAAELDELGAVMRRLRASAATEPVPSMSAALRAQILQPNVVPLVPAARARPSLRTGVLIAAAAAIVALIGVGAEQNRLPSGVQDVVSSVADIVGLDVPRAEERGDATGDDDSTDAEDGAVDGQGRPEVTNGGATPADPGEPGDKEPATPATPPEHSSGSGNGGIEDSPGATAHGQDNAEAGGGSAGEGTDTDVLSVPAPTPPTTSTAPNTTPRGGSRNQTTTDAEMESEDPPSSPSDTAPAKGK